MSNVFIDIHAIQSVPPSNLNRDDTGSPKTCVFGGVERARVSSQCWKRAMRTMLSYDADKYGVNATGKRTKNVPMLVTRSIMSKLQLDGSSQDELLDQVSKVLGKIPITMDKKNPHQTGALFFISCAQVDYVADLIIDAMSEDGSVDLSKIDKGDVKSALGFVGKNEQTTHAGNAIDMALFGRMVADDPDLNIDSAVQVAHAISVDKVSRDFDFYVAVDDESSADHAGGAMMGAIEYDSSTLYRYATISIAQLLKNLGDKQAAATAVYDFIDVFTRSMPTGKQTSFAAQTLPSLVIVTVRKGRPVSYAGAFERPVSHANSISESAYKQLMEYADDIAALYGDDDVLRTYVVHLGDQPSMDGDEVHCSYSQMLDSVVENVNDILNNIES